MKHLSLALRDMTAREAAWFFREVGGKVPADGDPAVRAAAMVIDGWFHRTQSFHRGVLDLRFTRRSWPVCIRTEFRSVASLVVRIECAQHPAIGTTEEVEAASVERLRELVRMANIAKLRRGGRMAETLYGPELAVKRLFVRAGRYVNAAVAALARVRDEGPCVIPRREAH